TSQQGGGTRVGGQAALVPEIQPRCCSARDSGERKSSFEITPVRNRNCCGARKVSERSIRSAARRRVRKSRGEQDGSKSRARMLRARMNSFRMRERGSQTTDFGL